MELHRLLRHARIHSEHYRLLLPDCDDVRLEDLPVLKGRVHGELGPHCGWWRLHLDDVESRLRNLENSDADPGLAWRSGWWLAATAGSTGRRAALAWNRQEWTDILSSYTRVNDWAGVKVGLKRRLPLR